MLTLFDIEICPNDWLIRFKEFDTGEYTSFWAHERDSFLGILSYIQDRTLVGFNSEFFDMPIMAAILENNDPKYIKDLADKIISDSMWPWVTYRYAGLTKPNVDHIDVMGISPGFVGLKAYGGRMHMPTIQDLPFDHTEEWTPDMYNMVEDYCGNDLDTTEELMCQLGTAIELRVGISKRYDIDVRSKSDTQVAEKILITQLGLRYGKNKIPETVMYDPPNYLLKSHPRLKELAKKLSEEVFNVNQKTGHVIMPKWLKEPIEFCGGIYKMGIGGLHSKHDTKVAYNADDDWQIFEIDAASFYPTLLINRGFAAGLGKDFIKLYEQIYNDRLSAKAKMKITTNKKVLKELKALDAVKKIMLNGTFGKLAAKNSPLYSLEAMLYITLTGQLTMLQLIDKVTKVGAIVVSANTDGIVVKVKRVAGASSLALQTYITLGGGVNFVKQCQGRGGALRLLKYAVNDYGEVSGQSYEFTEYSKVAFRDVNNYFALKVEGGIKRKGTYAKAGLSKNPVAEVCADAIAAWMLDGIPFADSIRSAKFQNFVTVRGVTGGGVHEGEYLGKVVRWYYSTEGTSIHYKKNGNLVPKSTGGKPCMTMSKDHPPDLDYKWYWNETKRIATDVGLITKRKLFIY